MGGLFVEIWERGSFCRGIFEGVMVGEVGEHFVEGVVEGVGGHFVRGLACGGGFIRNVHCCGDDGG